MTTKTTAGHAFAGGGLLASALAAAIMPGHAAAAEADTAIAATDSGEGDPIDVYGKREPDANPNADPDAPYKADRSANDKFTEELRDTPKSVTVIPKEVIEAMGANAFREVVRATPGVTLGTGEGGNAFGDRIFVRGFEARNDVYIDGLRDPGVTSREIFAVEQIEVVKGPSATYGGRGTTGGLVSVQSKRAATDRAFVIAEGGVGTENYLRGTLDINQPLADGVALRVNGLYHDADTPGRDYVDTERYGFSAALTAEVTEALTLRADYYLMRLDGMPDYGVPFDPATQEPADVPRDNFYGVIARDFIENEADVATLAMDYEATEGLTFHGTVRYGKSANRYIVSAPENPDYSDPDPANWTVTANPKNSNRDNEYWAANLYGVAEIPTGPIGHTIVFGGDFSDETVTSLPYSIDSSSNGSATNPIYTSRFGVVQNLYNPDPTVDFPFDIGFGSMSEVNVKSLAVYAIDTIEFTPQLKATIGARYDTFDLDYFTEDASREEGLQPLSLGYSEGFLNWQASLVYKPVEAMTLYASYATSSNPSGEQLDGNGASYDGISEATATLDPERNKAWEAGVKYEVQDNLLLTAAAYRITKENARENLGAGVYALAGELRSQGFEASAQGRIGPVQIFGGYTYTDAEITDSATPENIGAKFANIPAHSGSLLATLLIGSNFEIGGQVYAQSRIYGGTLAARDASVPGYARFDAVARWKPTDRIEARVNVLNLTDKVYYDAIYRSGTPFAYIAPGRSAFFTLTYKM